MKRFKMRNIVWMVVVMLIVPISSVSGVVVLDSDIIEPFGSDATVEELIEALPETATLDNLDLMLINRDNRLEADLQMNFAVTGSGHSYDAAIEEEFHDLISAAEAEGHFFQTISAYRTIAFQAANFDSRYNMYLNGGWSEADAYYMTDMFVAPADATEHSTGLAFDLLGYDWNEYDRDLHQAYGQYPSAIWLAENGHYYGFILRYMQGKTHITGYEYEPWHIRYVGVEHATFMYEHGLTLEEYVTLISLRDESND